MIQSSKETGRSMIEMLGVLAIIGVLSVGGIAGYSKAMMQYRINKTVDQITQVVGNVRTLFGSQKNYEGLNSPEVVKKAHLLPDEMWNTNSVGDDVMVSALGEAFYVAGGVSYDKKTAGDHKAFIVDVFVGSEEACMALATYDWGSGSSSGLIFLAVSNNSSGDNDILDGDIYTGCKGGTQGQTTIACPNGSIIPVPMPVDKAAEVCKDTSEIFIKFY